MVVSNMSNNKTSEIRSSSGIISTILILSDLRLRCLSRSDHTDDQKIAPGRRKIDRRVSPQNQSHQQTSFPAQRYLLLAMAPAVSSSNEKYEQNFAVYTNPAHDLKVVKTEIPEPGEGEVLVHVKATGICGRSAPFLSSKLTVAMSISGNMGELERRW
jgi:hypothetical protein